MDGHGVGAWTGGPQRPSHEGDSAGYGTSGGQISRSTMMSCFAWSVRRSYFCCLVAIKREET